MSPWDAPGALWPSPGDVLTTAVPVRPSPVWLWWSLPAPKEAEETGAFEFHIE